MARGFILRMYTIDNSLEVEQRFGALPIRIGRNSLNDCQVPHNFVSDFHARVELSEGRLAVRDLNSKNGVFLRSNKSMAPTRVAPQVPIDLAPYQNEFFVGPFLRAELQLVDTDMLDRDPKSTGTVLGNRQMLRADLSSSPSPSGQVMSGPSALPQLPSVAPLPSLGGPLAPEGANGPSPYSPQVHVPSGRPADPQGVYDYRGAPSPEMGPGVDFKMTGHFSMATELLALQGLRELAGSLVPGRPLETNGDIARLITKLHDAIEVFCRCFIPLRDGYAQFVSSLDLQRAAMQRSVSRSRSYAAVETAQSPAMVAAALLDWRDQSLDAPRAIEGIFADLMVHQVALLDGVMQGVRALLDELSPENIEKLLDARETRGPLGLQLGRYKSLWESFCAQYEQLSDEKQAFSRIFGPEFTQAYREYRRRRSDTSRTP